MKLNLPTKSRGNHHSVFQGISPFYLGLLKKILNLSEPCLYEWPPQNFGELDSPLPSNVPSFKKATTHFLKEQKILSPTMK